MADNDVLILFFVIICIYGILGEKLQFTLVTVSPTEAVALPGDSVSFTCNMESECYECRVIIPGYNLEIFNNTFTKKGVTYYFNSTQRKECSFTIRNVTERNNGDIECKMMSNSIQTISGKTNLIVAQTPKAPKFSSNVYSYYKENDKLIVKCTIADGRPVAKMKWYLDNKLLIDGITTNTNTSNLKFATITQTLNRTLSIEDHGRELKCVGNHIGFKGVDMEVRTKLNVNFALKDINIYGVKIGNPCLINVTVNANPDSLFEWHINGIPPQSANYDYHIAKIDERVYNVKFFLNNVTKEELINDFKLIFNNSQGSNNFTFRLSTLNGPEGIEFIIEIGITVALLLLIIGIVIIAKVTNSCCFVDKEAQKSYENYMKSRTVKSSRSRKYIRQINHEGHETRF